MVSVIVPVYNVEKYLKRCVDSLICQTYSDIEIILVDDGSTDASGIICEQYADCDSRIKVIHKANGGLSSARNAGIELASGKYISFVDSDDYVSIDYINVLINTLIISGAQISGINSVEGSANAYEFLSTDNYHTISRTDYLINVIEKPFCQSACGKLFSIELFENVRFPLNRVYEDTATTYLIFDKVDYIAQNDSCLYYYYKREGSIMNSQFSLNKLKGIESFRERAYYFLNKGETCIGERFLRQYVGILLKCYYVNKRYVKDKRFTGLAKRYIKESLGMNVWHYQWPLMYKLFGVMGYCFPYFSGFCLDRVIRI